MRSDKFDLKMKFSFVSVQREDLFQIAILKIKFEMVKISTNSISE